MTDIVERLREKRGIFDNRWPGPSQLELEAAAEIERLRSLVTREVDRADLLASSRPVKSAPEDRA